MTLSLGCKITINSIKCAPKFFKLDFSKSLGKYISNLLLWICLLQMSCVKTFSERSENVFQWAWNTKNGNWIAWTGKDISHKPFQPNTLLGRHSSCYISCFTASCCTMESYLNLYWNNILLWNNVFVVYVAYPICINEITTQNKLCSLFIQ